ncbi:MAG: DUF6261 family protein [Tannerellaceae bacterium]|jgi:hypothetical protein|nr:DUF6261 family protein [Tannerellaceae bacterium]
MTKFLALRYKFLLTKLHIGEHYDFFQNGIIDGLLAIIGSLPMLAPMFSALQTVFQREDDFYKQSLAATQTPEIMYLQEKRIALFNFLWYSVSMARYYENATKLQAAEKLQFLRNNYKHLPTATYQDASGIMTNFLEDCMKAEWKPSLEALMLMELVNMMVDANDAFKLLYRERSIDKATTAEIGKLPEIRADVDSAFDALIESINVAWQTNEMVAKAPAVREGLLESRRVVTAAISQAETNLARRGHKKTQDDGKVDEEVQTPDVTNPPAPETPPQAPDTSLPAAPDTPNQNPSVTPPPINPDDLNPPAAGE